MNEYVNNLIELKNEIKEVNNNLKLIKQKLDENNNSEIKYVLEQLKDLNKAIITLTEINESVGRNAQEQTKITLNLINQLNEILLKNKTNGKSNKSDNLLKETNKRGTDKCKNILVFTNFILILLVVVLMYFLLKK